jgi:hypothetical protein
LIQGFRWPFLPASKEVQGVVDTFKTLMQSSMYTLYMSGDSCWPQFLNNAGKTLAQVSSSNGSLGLYKNVLRKDSQYVFLPFSLLIRS